MLQLTYTHYCRNKGINLFSYSWGSCKYTWWNFWPFINWSFCGSIV